MDPDVDIWSMNEACAWPWLKRASAIFQMHRRPVFTRAKNDNDPNHWLWLQQDHDFPIYMLRTWPDVPASVRYPWEEVIEYTKPLRLFFSNSVPFMIALAIYKGYDWIGLFGIDQAVGTEWAYQRDCTSYWIAKAEGFGAHVYLPDECKLLRAKLYGYEGETMLSRHYFERRSETLDKEHEEAIAAVNVAAGKIKALADELSLVPDESQGAERLDELLRQAMKEERESLILAAAYMGRREENRLYMKELDELIQAEGLTHTEGDYAK
jgi:hypothetical protein